ncbi:MAG: hypothetical protein IPM71_07880 [Bacteroidota bacterium]|nr:MAG: hypothetical protein IPM71_07880 [Bacteroidota bacterium]
MRLFKAILIFYRKLLVPALILSSLVGFIEFSIITEFPFKTFGYSYMIFGLLFHYFIYEIRNYNEYYFYYNLGLSRLSLWISSLVLNFFVGLIFILL